MMPANTYGRAMVTVKVGDQASHNSSFFYYEVAKVKAPFGPTIGSTTVTIHGHGFKNFGFVAIRFGNESHAMQVNGTVLSPNKVTDITRALYGRGGGGNDGGL